MRNYAIKTLFFLYLTFLITISTFTFADNQSPSLNFIPYVDLTINAYWDPKYQDMEPVDLTAVSQASGITNYHLAFITDSGNCQSAWGGQSSYAVSAAWGSHLTDKMRASSISYIISFGGASGNDLSMACSESQLVAAYEQILQTYKPQGLDFDIENGSADVSKLMHAIKKIQDKNPDLTIHFTLPVMPEGLTAEGQSILNQAKENNLNFSVNIMTMDYGPAYDKDMGEYAIQAATNSFAFLKKLYPGKSDSTLWKMIEVTSMIGVNDVTIEQFTLENVDTLRSFAKNNNLGALAMWSVARDKPCADKWASPTCSGNNLQTKIYEFSQRFLGNDID